MNDNKRVIEINGVKFEVDMQSAKRVDEFKVGDNIKVLRKDYSSHKIENGVIVDFVNFKGLPTIQIAVFETTYSHSEIKFLNINAETEDLEIMPTNPHEMTLEKNKVVDSIDREITSLENRKMDLIAKKEWFLMYYGKHFEGGEPNDTTN